MKILFGFALTLKTVSLFKATTFHGLIFLFKLFANRYNILIYMDYIVYKAVFTKQFRRTVKEITSLRYQKHLEVLI